MGKQRIDVRDLAIQRMRILFELGKEAVRRGEIDLARRYGELIKRISMRVRVRIPRSIKRWICKNCNVIMVPGINARVRTRSEGRTLRIVTKCLSCGWIHRYEFVRRRERGAKEHHQRVEEEESSSTSCRR